MKKKIFPAILITAMLTLSACTVTVPTVEDITTPAASAVADTTAEADATIVADTTIAADTDEDTDDIKVSVEILEQSYLDYEMVEILELFSWDPLTPGQIEVNNAIQADVISRVENFEENFDESVGNGINVWAYSFTDENYIQIYNTVLEYPTYGTVGDLFGFVYDIANDDFITLEEYLASDNITGEEMAEKVMNLYLEANPTDKIGGVFLKTFRLSKDVQGNYFPTILFEMEVTAGEASEPYKSFYCYSALDGDVWQMNSEQLFDPYDIDEYDEPLHCHEGWYEYYYGDSDFDPSAGDPEENPMDILWDNLGDLTDGKTLVATGEEEINGEICLTYALGTNTPEKFTAEAHFAISPNYVIYTMDILQGPEWILYE
jgi:hypothetical protein